MRGRGGSVPNSRGGRGGRGGAGAPVPLGPPRAIKGVSVSREREDGSVLVYVQDEAAGVRPVWPRACWPDQSTPPGKGLKVEGEFEPNDKGGRMIKVATIDGRAVDIVVPDAPAPAAAATGTPPPAAGAAAAAPVAKSPPAAPLASPAAPARGGGAKNWAAIARAPPRPADDDASGNSHGDAGDGGASAGSRTPGVASATAAAVVAAVGADDDSDENAAPSTAAAFEPTPAPAPAATPAAPQQPPQQPPVAQQPPQQTQPPAQPPQRSGPGQRAAIGPRVGPGKKTPSQGPARTLSPPVAPVHQQLPAPPAQSDAPLEDMYRAPDLAKYAGKRAVPSSVPPPVREAQKTHPNYGFRALDTMVRTLPAPVDAKAWSANYSRQTLVPEMGVYPSQPQANRFTATIDPTLQPDGSGARALRAPFCDKFLLAFYSAMRTTLLRFSTDSALIPGDPASPLLRAPGDRTVDAPLFRRYMRPDGSGRPMEHHNEIGWLIAMQPQDRVLDWLEARLPAVIDVLERMLAQACGVDADAELPLDAKAAVLLHLEAERVDVYLFSQQHGEQVGACFERSYGKLDNNGRVDRYGNPQVRPPAAFMPHGF